MLQKWNRDRYQAKTSKPALLRAMLRWLVPSTASIMATRLIDTYVTKRKMASSPLSIMSAAPIGRSGAGQQRGATSLPPGNEPIGVSRRTITAEYNSEAMKQDEQVKKSNIAIIKHTDDGQTQIETPPRKAQSLSSISQSAGSYDNAKDSERDYLICSENGFAQTKDLPYGRYTVQQIKG